MYPSSIRDVDPVATTESDGRVNSGSVNDDASPPVATLDLTERTRDTSLLVVAPPEIGRVVAGAFADVPTTVTVTRRPSPERSSSDPYGLRTTLRNSPPVDGAVLVAPRDVALRDALPGPVVAGVPVGVVRAETSADLEDWLETIRAPRVHANTWAVLAMGKDEYLDPATDLYAQLSASSVSKDAGLSVSDWRASVCSRPDVCARLASGPALAVYHGHGRPRGWAGYQALRWRHVHHVRPARPIGLLASLACESLADPDSGGRPFGERFVHAARAVAVLGGVSDVRKDDVVTLSRSVGTAVCEDEVRSIGGLLRSVHERLRKDGAQDVLAAFRLVGLPTHPIR